MSLENGSFDNTSWVCMSRLNVESFGNDEEVKTSASTEVEEVERWSSSRVENTVVSRE